MLDAVVSGACIFEPNEVVALREAYAQVRRRMGHAEDADGSLATILLNLARTRLRLKQHLVTPGAVRQLAEDAFELQDYLRNQSFKFADAETRRPADRTVGLFPASFAAPVRSSFRNVR